MPGMRPTTALLMGALSLGAAACGGVDAAEHASTETWRAEPVREGNLRVATFNIRNYPTLPPRPDQEPRPDPLSYSLHTDDDALIGVLAALEFDVLAVQEIVDTERFTALLAELTEVTGRDYHAVFSDNAHSDNAQHVGVIVADDLASIAWTREHPEVDTRGTLRSGLSARIESHAEDGIDFGLMVLHLASGSSNKRAELRATQAEVVATIVQDEQAETGDADYLVMGDLNTARGEEELVTLDVTLADGTGLVRNEVAAGCSSYWVKKSTNPLLRVSLLDHIYHAGMTERDAEVRVAVGAHCAVNACQQFESTSPDTGGTFWDVSDHCPVYFEVTDTDDDAPAGD